MKQHDKDLLFKALCNYLPYSLDVKTKLDTKEMTLSDNHSMLIPMQLVITKGLKPLVRPLSDIFNVIEFKGGITCVINALRLEASYEVETEFINHMLDFKDKPYEISWDCCPRSIYEELLSMHFDLLNLLEKGLAEPIKEYS